MKANIIYGNNNGVTSVICQVSSSSVIFPCQVKYIIPDILPRIY